MNGKLRSLAATLIISLFCTGCWDSIDIDRLAIVVATGMDVIQGSEGGKKTIGVTMQIARASDLGTAGGGGSPSAQTGTTQAFILQEGTGEDVFHAGESIRHNLSRQMFLGHRRIIVLGEDFARQGISELVDEVVRNPSSRLRSYIVVAYHDTAKDILKRPVALDRLPSDAIYTMAQASPLADVDTKIVAQDLLEPGIDPFTLGLRPTQEVPDNTGKAAESFDVQNVALFQGDKLVGWLDTPASVQGFMWLSGHVKQDELTVRLPTGKHVSLRVLNLKSAINSRLVGGRPQINFSLTGDLDVRQSEVQMDLNQPKVMQLVRSAVETQMQQQTEATLKILQEKYQVDPLGVGHSLYIKYPGVWRSIQKTWPQAYKGLSIHVNTPTVRIKDSGLIGPSITTKLGNH